MLASLSKYSKGGGVIVKTRRELTRFAQGLPDDEFRYIHFIVRRALVGDVAVTDR